MPKRSYGALSLTGGTGDVNPQYLSGFAGQSANDTETSTTVSIPIQRLPTSGRAQVMEILKVIVRMPTPLETDSNVGCAFSTSSKGTTAAAWSDGQVFAQFDSVSRVTTSGQFIDQRFQIRDLTDGAGHGYLVATDNIYVQVYSSATSTTNTVSFKIYYRWKNIGLPEYVGIVQSQQ